MWIMTSEGWKRIVCATAEPTHDSPFRNPFRCWENAGAKSFKAWLATG